MKFLQIIFITALIVSCNKNDEQDDSCNGNTRREVKILSDTEASTIDFNPIKSSIDSLGNIQVSEPDRDTPRMAVEKAVYTVTAVVDKVKKEPDGDYHLRLKSGEIYMIVEVPNTYCEYVANSTFLETYKTVRSFVQQNDLEGKTVTVTGVAFVDIDHHYKRKQAKNNLELHPLIDIHF
jgi:hypothetical protein